MLSEGEKAGVVSNTVVMFFLFFKQKTAYDVRISDWSSDVCSSDLREAALDALVRDYLRTHPPVAPPAPAPAPAPSPAPATPLPAPAVAEPQIGRASCRERECQYV